MKETELDNINIAIASHEQSQRIYLRMAMEANGLSVVLNDPLSKSFIEKLHQKMLESHHAIQHEQWFSLILPACEPIQR